MAVKEQEINRAYENIRIEKDSFGEVKISADVVAGIAALAAIEVEGVESTLGSFTNEIAGKLGVKNLSKVVKAVIEEEKVMIEMNIVMKYGYNILKTCKQIQDRVGQSVENMTGFEVKEVNIRIAGVSISKDE